MALHLQPGTVLDDRYRIDAVLGQGGFGITYAAENTRLGMKVAVKELFWRDHSVRAAEASPEVALTNAMDGKVFEEQKQRFLREARILKDLDQQPGVVRVIDFFEANGTVYIVMEFVDGETLAAKAAAGPMPAGELLRRFLPLVDTLAQIHRQGVIHRDISPENIMVQPDGSLKLIDFGAAREFQETDGHYTSLSRESYSPNEQYDSNGRQGPWTDVYALCATVYNCVCGAPPQSAVQRMFLDELKSPSELGVEIDPAYEVILMKGLKLWSGDRYQSMEALAADIRAALPGKGKNDDGPRNRWILIGLAAGLLCAVAALALWLILRGGQERFGGAVTEKLRITAPSDLTAADFAAAQTELRARLDSFVGKDNYILQVKGDHVDVEFPMQYLGELDAKSYIIANFKELVPGKAMNWQYQIQANWEDPAKISDPGANQVAYSQMQGETLVYLYATDADADMKYFDIDLQELKKRLDTLDTPYAFGTLYGNDDCPVFRISPKHFSKAIENTLGQKSLTITGTTTGTAGTVNPGNCRAEVVETEGGVYTLRIQLTTEWDREKFETRTRAMVNAGLDTLFLCNYSDKDVFASARIDAPVTDGIVEFSELRMKEASAVDADHRWVLDYLATLLADTELSNDYQPVSCDRLEESGVFDFDVQSESVPFGLNTKGFSTDEKTLSLMERIQEETGYAFRESGILVLDMNLPVNDDLPAAIAERVPALMDEYDLWHAKHAKDLYVVFAEGEDYSCHLYVCTMYDYVQEKFYNACMLYGSGEKLKPYAEAVTAWWAAYGPDEYDRVSFYDD